MDSKRRMVEIHIWNQAFFSQLDRTEKLFYWFIITNCDNVGVYSHNPKLALFHCDGEVNLENFVDTVNFDQERIEILPNGSLWIKGFVRDTWGTIAAGNNLGLSCYKLLVKHDLLDRFIKKCPNNINIKSFREYILENKNGYADLPLPQAAPSLPQKNGVSEEYEGQGSPKPATINIPINDNKSISINTLYQSLKEVIPIPLNENPEHVYLADIERVSEQLIESDIQDIKNYLLNAVKSYDWENGDWETFTETLTKINEVPF